MKKTAMNMERVRRQNRSLILNCINDNGPSSRKDIAQATGLTQASVTQITTALIEEGIIKEAGTTDEPVRNAGRRKILLKIEAGAFLTFAVNAEPDRTSIAVCDLMGNVIEDKEKKPLLVHFPTDRKAEPEAFLGVVAKRCMELKERMSRRLAGRIECLSFAITGIVDRENGISKHAYGIWDREVDVRTVLGTMTDLPVMIENNVDAFAIAELLFGTGRTHDDLLVIKWGPGVGSSVVIDDHVYRGRHGKTAELGHLIVDPGGKQCVCGRRGCLETRVSANALAAAGSEKERERSMDMLARSIVNAGTILAPRRIVLFGTLSGNEKLREELISACRAYDGSFDEKRIIHTSLFDKESYIGPAAFYTMNKFQA